MNVLGAPHNIVANFQNFPRSKTPRRVASSAFTSSSESPQSVVAVGKPRFLRSLLPTPTASPNSVVEEQFPIQTEPLLATQIPSAIRPIISLSGGGVFFFWQLGVLNYLQQHFDLAPAQFIGASAGALCSVLTACNVDPHRAVREAYRLSLENNIWERPSGLAGIWANLIRQWLDELLPADAVDRCSGRVKVIVTEIPSLRLKYVDTFDSRDDLIDACMASVHIPFFLDGNATFAYKGVQYVDGSLWDFLSGSNSDLLTCDGRSCIIDYVGTMYV